MARVSTAPRGKDGAGRHAALDRAGRVLAIAGTARAAGARRCDCRGIVAGEALLPAAATAGLAGSARRRVLQVRAHHARGIQPGLRAAASAGARHADVAARGTTTQREVTWARPRWRNSESERNTERAFSSSAPRRRCRASGSRRCSSKRLRATVRNAYDNVPLHRKRLDDAGVAPDGDRQPRRHRPAAVHAEERSARPLSVRHVRAAAGRARAPARVVGHHRQADGRRLHDGATSTTGPT